jgi:hypothetical protein
MMWRYEHNGGDMEIADDGEWVKWSEFEKLQKELRRICEFVESGQHMAAHVQAAASMQRFEEGWKP